MCSSDPKKAVERLIKVPKALVNPIEGARDLAMGSAKDKATKGAASKISTATEPLGSTGSPGTPGNPKIGGTAAPTSGGGYSTTPVEATNTAAPAGGGAGATTQAEAIATGVQKRELVKEEIQSLEDKMTPDIKTTKPPPPPKLVSQTGASAARNAQRERLRRSKGAMSLVQTGGRGMGYGALTRRLMLGGS